MSKIFISHSSANNAAALALGHWLDVNGWGEHFLDVSPARGLSPGERWQEALKAASDRCQAVLFLLSPAWRDSKWCLAEFLLAKNLGKAIFGVLIEETPLATLPHEMTAEWQLCDLVFGAEREHFQVSMDPVVPRARVSFSKVGLERLRLGLQKAGLDATTFPWPPPEDPARIPFRGLRALEAADAAVFFGRDADVVRGLDALRSMRERGIERALVILGASGSGKSSFLRAGLLPRLKRDDRHFLPLSVIRPERAVISGSNGLAASLEGAFGGLKRNVSRGDLRRRIERGELPALLSELQRLGCSRLEPGAPAPSVVIPIDQAEELFGAEGRAEAEAFLSALADVLAEPKAQGAEAIAARQRALAIVAIRSESYVRLQTEPRLERVKPLLFNLNPIARGEFKAVIEGPAARATAAGPKTKLTIEPELTANLLAEAEGADALPLLAYALERLFVEYGADGDLRLDEYRSLGGIRGCLDAAIENALSEPGRDPAVPADKAEREVRLRRAFIPWLALVDPDTAERKRRVARWEEFSGEARPLLERLVAARLLVRDRRRVGVDGHDEVVVEIAHEALLRQWPALASWLDADAGALQRLEAARRAAAEWQKNGRAEVWLVHAGERLSAAEELRRRPDFERLLGEEGRSYLGACRSREDAARAKELLRLEREARSARRLRWLAGGLTLALGVTAAVGWTALQKRNAANAALAASDFREAVRRVESGRSDQALPFSASALRLSGARSGARAVIVSQAAHVRYPSSEMRHESEVKATSFNADGTRVVTASLDSTARIWDAKSGAPLGEPLRHDGWVLAASFSADGTRVVTASVDKTARIWDARTGAPLGEPLRHEGPVMVASFNPDGTRVVTAGSDETARIWDARTGAPVGEPLQHEGPVSAASFSADGARIVTASWDKTARIWNAETGAPLGEPLRHESWVEIASFSPDGTRVVTAVIGETAQIWDARTGAPLGEPLRHDGYVMAASFSADGTRVVTASLDKTARIWDARTGTPLGEPLQHEGAVMASSFSPDGHRVLTASVDKTARIWDARTPGEPLPHESTVWAASFSPDGTRVVTASADGTARIWDARAGAPLGEALRHEDQVEAAAFSEDGARVVTASADRTARVWDARTGAPLGEPLRHQDKVEAASFSHDGQRVVTASWDKTARIWDARTGAPLGEPLRHEDQVKAASFSPDGHWVLTASLDKTARIWDARTGAPLGEPLRHQDKVEAASFSADGSRVVTASWDKTARIWDARTGKPVAKPLQHQDVVWTASFSPDGQRVVTGSWDETVQIWDAKTGAPLGEPLRLEGAARAASFSPDGQRVVTVTQSEDTRIWDARTGAPMGEPLRHEGGAFAASFSPDGALVVTAGMDETARIWDARTGAPVGEPLRHEGSVMAASFSADGARVVTASWDKTARVWDVDVVAAKASNLRILLEASEILPGHVLNESRALMPLPDWVGSIKELRKRVANAPPGEPTVPSYLRWVLDDPWTRTISPYSGITVPEYIRAQTKLCIPKARQEVERAYVGHPVLREPFDCNRREGAGPGAARAPPSPQAEPQPASPRSVPPPGGPAAIHPAPQKP